MKLIRSNLDDPTRTSLLVGSSKLEAASIRRPLSFQTMRGMSLIGTYVPNADAKQTPREHVAISAF
jgi:hypothetical protein